VDRVNTPDFATAVGLVLYGFNQLKGRGISKDKKKPFLAKLKDWLKET
jgi:cell division protein FtsA